MALHAVRPRLLTLALLAVAPFLTSCGGSETDDAATGAATHDHGAHEHVVETGAVEVAPLDRQATTGVTSDAGRAVPGARGPSLAELLRLPDPDNVTTPDVAVLGGRDFVTGDPVRVPLALVDKGGEPVAVDGGRAQVYLARSATTPTLGPFPARLETIAVPGARFDDHDTREIFVARPEVPVAGAYFLVATYTVGGDRRSANTGISFAAKELTPRVGAPAPRSDTPTLASTGGDLEALTTATPPDRSLLEHSVAESIAARQPFVLVFATPQFCASRLCGPIISVVQHVQGRLARTPVRFIHVEIYEGNDPDRGLNRWVREWRLPTEPWVFVVGGDGRVAAKFEGAVSARELEAAARGTLP